MKSFSWQAKDEKILYFGREFLLSFVARYFYIIFGIFIISLILIGIFYVLKIYIAIALLILWLILTIIFFVIIYKNTYFIITNKRLLKFVRSWFFSEHVKELKLDQINELTFERNWFLKKLFNFGNIKIVWKDREAVMWVIWLKYPDEIVQYISRLKDFIKENPDFEIDKLLPFIPRKIRKKWKK